MRVTRVRGFKAAAVIAVGGAGAGATIAAGASELPTTDGVGQTSLSLPDKDVTLGPSEQPTVPASDIGTAKATVNGVTVYDSSNVRKGAGSPQPDIGEDSAIQLAPAGDDAPVAPLGPARVAPDERSQSLISRSAGQPATAAAAAWCGSMFQLRGGSLVPPYDGKVVYWDAPGSGYEVRRIIGAECLGDNQNFTFQQSDGFKSSGYNSTYGRRVVHKDGWIFEGCTLATIPPFGVTQYQCDFKSQQNYRLTPQTTSAFFRERLRNWAAQTAQNQGSCATTIIGTWVGTNDLGDVGVACIDNGPVDPHGL